MRTYKSKINIPKNLRNQSIGKIGQSIFEIWYKRNFEGEDLHEQVADNDYKKIDFTDWKANKYQVKATSKKTYTFNCLIEDVEDHLTCNYYAFIQVDLENNIAYLEDIYTKDYVKTNIKPSFKYNNCFIWKKDLQQNMLEI